MKKIIRLTESDLTRIVRKTIVEMEKNSEGLSKSDWADIWIKLRRTNKSFQYPDDFNEGLFIYGGLDFHYKDGILELEKIMRDPYWWNDDYDKGVAILEKYNKKLYVIFEESDLGLEVKEGPNFELKIQPISF